MKIVVIGGAGFIGANLCEYYKDEKLFVVDNLSTGNNVEIVEKYCYGFYKLDILEASDYMANVIFTNADVVFNLVGKTSHSASMTNPVDDAMANVCAPLKVLEMCKKYCPKAHIIYTGTRGQYGKTQYLPIDEKHPLEPLDINGANKLAAEKAHMLYASAYNMNITCLRLTNIFGKYHQDKTPDGVFNWFVYEALRGNKIKIYGADRDVIFVDELIDAFNKIINNPRCYGEIYNVGGRRLSFKRFANCLNSIIPTDIEVLDKTSILDVGDVELDCSKLYLATKWLPSQKTLGEAIKEVVNWKQNS
jgi:nucleoside-diphosphate-sugar epimerase